MAQQMMLQRNFRRVVSTVLDFHRINLAATQLGRSGDVRKGHSGNVRERVGNDSCHGALMSRAGSGHWSATGKWLVGPCKHLSASILSRQSVQWRDSVPVERPPK